MDQDYSVGLAGTGGGSADGGGSTGCAQGEQDNDQNGTCEPACSPESCSGHGTCDDGSGSVACTCDERFSGDVCASCSEAYAGPECTGCASGYQDRDDDGTCELECGEESCSGHGTCDDSAGTAQCLCRPPYQGDQCAEPCPTGTAGAGCEYRILYGLDIAAPVDDWNVPADVPYDVDNAQGAGPFDRVAYRLVLDDGEVWVEMDPFTTVAAELGVPVDVVHETPITNVTVLSFASNQSTIAVPTEGNVEMWSNCYSVGLNDVYDYDDDIDATDCYGSLQVHVNSRPVLSFNRWSQGSGDHDIGIGESPTGNPDFTFEANAGDYAARRLEVYVRAP